MARNHRVHLVVEDHTAAIEVGGSPRAPDAVDRCQLGMRHRILHFVHVRAGFQQITVRRACRKERRRHLGMAGQYKPHVHAGESDLAKIFARAARWDELAGEEPHVVVRAQHCGHQGEVGQRPPIRGRAANDANRLHAGARQPREVTSWCDGRPLCCSHVTKKSFRSSAMAGPSMHSAVSRQYACFRLPLAGTPADGVSWQTLSKLMPPVKPMRPSTTRISRWPRYFGRQPVRPSAGSAD